MKKIVDTNKIKSQFRGTTLLINTFALCKDYFVNLYCSHPKPDCSLI